MFRFPTQTRPPAIDPTQTRPPAIDTSPDFMDRWAAATAREVAEDPFQRSHAFIEFLLPLMEKFAAYFGAWVEGMSDIPTDRPVLLVGNHSGGMITPDTTALMAAWYRHFGLKRPLATLAFDASFSIPGFKKIMRGLGLVPASQKNAMLAMARGESVLVYPGGVWEVFRPWKDRNKIDFNDRKGFIKLAIRSGVTVIPVVGHGGHQSTVVLSRGEWLARKLRYERLRLDVAPLLFTIPWGVTTPAFVGIPLPSKIRVRVLEPLDWSRYAPEEADDPDVLDACYREITAKMQSTLDELAVANRNPVWRRLREIAKL